MMGINLKKNRRLRMAGMLAALAISTSSHADKIYFVHNDHLGTPQVMTDENKNVVWEVDRDPWGNITNVLVDELPNNVSLPGQHDDVETSYSDNWHRVYDKRLGQYLQSDPVGLRGGINTYVYVGSNPANWIDFTGLLTRPVAGGIRPPDKAAPTGGGAYDAPRSRDGGVSHGAIDYLNPPGAPVVAPEGGYIESTPNGDGQMICRSAGTEKCEGCDKEIKKKVCWRLVHINPTYPQGPVSEGAVVGTTVPSAGAPHVHVEYYIYDCKGWPRKMNPEDIFGAGGL